MIDIKCEEFYISKQLFTRYFNIIDTEIRPFVNANVVQTHYLSHKFFKECMDHITFEIKVFDELHLGKKIAYNTIDEFRDKNFKTPFCFIIPSKMHFLEKEILEGFED